MVDTNTVSFGKRGETVDVIPTNDPRGDKTPKKVLINDFRNNLRGYYLKKFNDQIEPALRAARTAQQRNRKNGQRKVGNEGVKPVMGRKN